MLKRVIALALGAGLVLAASPRQTEVVAQAQQALVIEGGTLIDGDRGAPLADSIVVVQANRITAAGRRGQVQRPANAQVINAAGKFLLPGFIDAKSNHASAYNEGNLIWGVVPYRFATAHSRNQF